MLRTMVFLSIATASFVANADTYVDGHTRSNGTYVQPHHRSDKNHTVDDNWTTKGNVNPYTGKRGYK